MAFIPSDEVDLCREALVRALESEDLELMAWRPVPVDSGALGALARSSMPRIEQAIIRAGDSVADMDRFERRLLLARKAADRSLERDGVEGFSVASASCRTVVYKGLFTARHIEDFYLDFTDPAFETDFAIFHQRYSTNTVPSWDRGTTGPTPGP